MHRLLSLICFLGLVACSSSSGRQRNNNNNNNHDAGLEQPGADLAIDPGDGGTTTDGKPSTGDQSAPATLTGTLELQQQGYAYAYFAYVTAGSSGTTTSGPFTCVTENDCTACWTGAIVKPDMTPVDLWKPADLTPPIYDLATPDLWAPDLKPEVDLATVMANAGTISVTNVDIPFELTPSSAGTYGYYYGLPLWTDPVTIHVAASGTLDVPAFETELEAPAAGSITTAPPIIDRGKPYTMTWPKADGVLQSTMTTYYYLGSSTATVSCTFDRSKGSATIPPSLLSHLYPSADSYVTQVSFRSGSSKQLTSGKAKIQLNATVGIPAPSGQDPFSTL